MAVETEFSITLRLVFSGFWKANRVSNISEIYKGRPHKKDEVYFFNYLVINAINFVGSLLSGYLGDKVGWKYGFGLAGIFMFIEIL